MRDKLADERAVELIKLIQYLIPNWQKVSLTKEGYNKQYTQTLLDVAIFVIEREQKVLKEFMELENE